MAIYAYPVAALGSFVTRQLENEVNENTTKFLAKNIDVEEATRIISENVQYYLPIVTVKAICDVILTSLIGRNLYYLFKKLWTILKPLFTSGLIRALCEKFNINFFKYALKGDEELKNGNSKDEPLRYIYEIPLEQLLHGTERQLQITREIRELNKTTRIERETYPIIIQPGCKEEHVICLTEVGDRDPINTPADLFIIIRSKPHPLYKRQGADLIYIKTMSYADVSPRCDDY
ncbi:unnamed protein product [Rotaria sp. Silwood2]|nr:unnamed protein product [Rotaria sp. Silwood2]